MNSFTQLVSSLREQMSATLSRTDVLKPLAWLVGIIATVFVASIVTKAVVWVLVFEAILLFFGVFLYFGAYVFCLIRDRDSLRSEKYSLHKMAIEHGFFGDDRTGLLELNRERTPSTGAMIVKSEHNNG